MSIEGDIEEIRRVWLEIEADTKYDLGMTWLERDKLVVMSAETEVLESKVLNLLKIISASRHDKRELKKHMEHLISLLHHVKPTREWQREITEELDVIAREISPHLEHARGSVKELLQARRQTARLGTQNQINVVRIELCTVYQVGHMEPVWNVIGSIT